MQSIKSSIQQFTYLFYDVNLIVNKHWLRLFSCWFSQAFWIVLNYRFNRSMYLLLGRGWQAIRWVLSPLNILLHPWFGSIDIHYGAEIGKGLIILHPSLGIVISKFAIIGSHLTLTGGNCIGGRPGGREAGKLVLGDYVSLGANAVVLGPVQIGSHVQIGAGAVVVKDAPDGALLVGVPAKNIANSQ